MKKLILIFVSLFILDVGSQVLAESHSISDKTVKKEYKSKKEYKKKSKFFGKSKEKKQIPIDGGLTFFLIAAGASGISFIRKNRKNS